MADEARDLYSEKYERNLQDIYVVDNSLDIKQFTNAGIIKTLDIKLKTKYKGKIVFGYVGAILPNRGLKNLFEILPQIKSDDIKIIIVGHGQKKKDLLNIIRLVISGIYLLTF